MNEITFTKSLEKNIEIMQEIFQNDNTFIVRRAKSANGLCCAAFFFDGMVNSIAINDSIVKPVVLSNLKNCSADILASTVLQTNDSKVEPDVQKMFYSMLYGDTVVFTEGDNRAVVVNTKGFMIRSPSEPENERVVAGPHEGFTECFMPNLALMRRRITDKNLKFTFMRVGRRSNTNICLCYLADMCEEKLIAHLTKKIKSLDIDSVLDGNYLAERIRDHRFSPFPTLGTTERPDVACSRILEGRCVIVVDGSPIVLTAPYLLQECFQSNDDYYIHFLQANAARILRILGFLCSITIPALYVSVLLYHRELIPSRLFFAITAAQRGVPLPVAWETFIMLFVLDMLKEAGARTPGAIGQTMSIVGGLVLGQAAVSARFVAAPTVIVVAIAGVTDLMVPKLQNATIWLRLFFLLSAAAYGLYGVSIAFSLVLALLCRMHSCSVPYLLNLIPRVHSEQEDAWLRLPWFLMRYNRTPTKKEHKK